MGYRYQYWEEKTRLVDTQIDSILENRDMELAAFRLAKIAPKPVKRANAKSQAEVDLNSALKALSPEKLTQLRFLLKKVGLK